VSGPFAQPRPTPCEEEECLVDAYGAAVNEYSRTVIMLRTRQGPMPRAQYDEIRDFSEKARLRCKTAHAALDKLIQEHGC
jgi:hypothetical protein